MFLHTSPADKENSGRQGWQVVIRVQGALVDPHRQIFREDVRAVTNPWFSLSQVGTKREACALVFGNRRNARE